MYTKEQFEKLKPFETYFYTAKNYDYVRNLGYSDAMKMQEIHKEIYGKEYPLHISCGHCQLQFCRVLAVGYYEAKAVYESEPKDVPMTGYTAITEEVKEEKPKDETPKKTNKATIKDKQK